MSATAIAALSLALSANAQSTDSGAATAQTKAECRLTMPFYSDASATIEQKYEYAHCVGLMHEQPMSDEVTIFFKVVIVLTFAAFFLGLKHGEDALERFLLCVLYPLAVPVFAFLFLLAVAAINFLFK